MKKNLGFFLLAVAVTLALPVFASADADLTASEVLQTQTSTGMNG